MRHSLLRTTGITLLVAGVFCLLFGFFHGVDSSFESPDEPAVRAFRKTSGSGMVVGGALAGGCGAVLWFVANKKKDSR
jgi:drug/metabolite transporter (DMT)-like permease